MGGGAGVSEKCEFCGRVVFMSTFGLMCLECDELPAKQNRIRKLEAALQRIRDCDWPGPLPLVPSRADWMQETAKKALND